MKNKKIISRVLAIFAVLVLMVSMALPAFADEGISSNLSVWEEFYNTYNTDYGNLAFDEMYASEFGGEYVQNIDDFYLFSFVPHHALRVYGSLAFYYNNDNQYSGSLTVGEGYGKCVFVEDGISESFSFFIMEVDISANSSMMITFYDSSFSIICTVYYVYDSDDNMLVYDELANGLGEVLAGVQEIHVAFALYGDTLAMSDDVVKTLTDDTFGRYSPASFYDGMYLSNRPDGVVPPSRTGMFGQIYYILYDAIYGSDAVIGTSQDFVLTQIATWMTYIVILLPLLVVAIFLWRVFAR